jgi:hypothetical protein
VRARHVIFIFIFYYTGLTQPIRLLAWDSNCEHPKLPSRIKPPSQQIDSINNQRPLAAPLQVAL